MMTADDAFDIADTEQFQAPLLYMAWRRYRIQNDVAEDLIQAAILTFLEVRDRYPKSEEHPKILVGIFRNKCREHINGQIRTARGLRALRAAAEGGDTSVPAVTTDSTMDEGVLSELAHREDGRLILRALSECRPRAREIFRLLAEDGVSRRDLIRELGLNKNTLDSRLHAYRGELRRILAHHGYPI